MAAIVAAIFLLRAFLMPTVPLGGHFDYGTVRASIGGRIMMVITALGAGVGGAVVGTCFHNKGLLRRASKKSEDSDGEGKNKPKWRREVLVKTSIGLIFVLLGSWYPQTLFWGEGSLQCVVDGQKTAFSATKHGLSTLLTSNARVNPSVPFRGATDAIQVWMVKLLAIALACAGKFPGGIIFPLFFAAAALAHGFASIVSPGALPVLVMSLMASTQASVTRKPLATAFILSLSASASAELSVMLPSCLVASYVGVWVSQFCLLLSRNSYFKYSK